MSRSLERRNGEGWLFVSPYLLFTAVFFAIPLVWSLVLIFYNWNLISPTKTFVGFKHFVEAVKSPRVWSAFFVSFKFLAIFVPVVMGASIVLALIIDSVRHFKRTLAVGFFMPYLASGVALSLVVQGILSYTSPLNEFLRRVTGGSPDWLGTPTLAVIVIASMLIWKFAGYYALIFLSGLQSIPKSLHEAAQTDGAGAWIRFWKITLPMLFPAFYTVLILSSGIVFSIFTEPFVLTKGGPNLATQTWQLEIYYQAFERFRAGYGATVAVLNAVVTFAAILIIRRLANWWGGAYGFEKG